jgi:NTP pyrophosphatase (non-canonical NTP hydrolase)
MDSQQQLLFRIGFLHEQVSGIFAALKHMIRGTEKWEKSRANLAYIKSEIGDLIVQTHLLCTQLKMDYEECEELGWKRYNEIKAKWDESGYGNKWV